MDVRLSVYVMKKLNGELIDEVRGSEVRDLMGSFVWA